MPIEMHEQDGRVLEVQVSGKLTKADYALFVPKVDALIEQCGRIRILVRMQDFHGWKAGALWEDTKFAMRHFSDIERLAVVGEKQWQKGITTFCRPFTKAEIRYFDREHQAEAQSWLQT